MEGQIKKIKLKHIIIVLLVVFGIVATILIAYIVKFKSFDPRNKAASSDPLNITFNPNPAGLTNGVIKSKVMLEIPAGRNVQGASIVLKYDKNVLVYDHTDNKTDGCDALGTDLGITEQPVGTLVISKFEMDAEPTGTICLTNLTFRLAGTNTPPASTTVTLDDSDRRWEILDSSTGSFTPAYPGGKVLNITLNGAVTTVPTNTTAPTSTTVNSPTPIATSTNIPTTTSTQATPTTKATPTTAGVTVTKAPTTTQATAAITALTLTVPEGHVFNTANPVLTGKAPAGSKIEVTVNSTEQKGTVTATSSGNWSFTPPTALEAGTHTYYATLVNSDGSLGDKVGPITFSVASNLPDTAYKPTNTVVLLGIAGLLITISLITYKRKFK